MKKETLQRARGVRDFNPSEKIARNKILDVLKIVFEDFGYNPIETPVLERYDLFASKYGIGQESDAMRETFRLKDQGKRDLVLRTELTVPFARFVAMNPQFKFPFKRYQIGQVFRDGPIKLGRYREFWQCDVDVVGIANPLIDSEILQLVNTVFKRLNLEVEIRINNRKVLNAILDYVGIPADQQSSALISIDKLDKIDVSDVTKELKEKGINANQTNQALKIIKTEGTNSNIIKQLRPIIGDNAGLKEVEETIRYTIDNTNIVFTPALARGLAYYTGNVFEVYLKDSSQISSALCGGGRYDDMIGGLIGSGEKIPTVGISFGLETIFTAIKILNLNIDDQKSVTQVYVVPIAKEQLVAALSVADELRKQDIAADVDYLGRKLNKNMEYATSYGITWLIIVGEDEVKEKKLTLRNLDSGKQEKLSLQKIIQLLRK